MGQNFLECLLDGLRFVVLFAVGEELLAVFLLDGGEEALVLLDLLLFGDVVEGLLGFLALLGDLVVAGDGGLGEGGVAERAGSGGGELLMLAGEIQVGGREGWFVEGDGER